MWSGRKLGSSGGWFLRVLGPGGCNTKAARPLISSAVYVKNQLSGTLQIKPGVFNEYRTIWFKSYRTIFSCLNRIKSFRYPWARLYSTSQTTVDSGEVKTFLALAHKWWDEQGVYAPLHSMNDLRVPFIRDNLLKTIPNHQPGKPLLGMKILDVGCGGGLLTEPGGSLFITTINKTQLSYALGIVFSEQIASIVPKGTHTWEKFVSPETLESILESNGLSVQTVVGMLYNPFSGYWHWSENTSLNYAAYAVKSRVQEHPASAEFVLKGETEELQANACTNPAVHEKLKK
ncbi:ubiquinone biosynthesis O-methyltransferase, mitochondrial isoform X3 [Homo sapiens]|uniref:ubiquinone biosynthesis O-methyltransferase, mitochondrial isoform X3 n=1 Tax=Homo sapiens TaxID=9606 RepID=UPI000387B445|nr:ubiquinone biosynthesis O-methyltransferase, mitochondrial isoform X3 [Homo sapiens]|eukprot:XP_005267075.1 ubiquinone biosynthesis O-methyltransferase, mitochondrial isoform X3 [Homo sapiens]